MSGQVFTHHGWPLEDNVGIANIGVGNLAVLIFGHTGADNFLYNITMIAYATLF